MEIKDTFNYSQRVWYFAGARDYDDGPFSGKEFYDKFLQDRFVKAKDEGYILRIDIDGFWGWSSFVSGSFGLLSMKYGAETVLKHLELKCVKNPLKITKAIYEINNP